MQCFFQTANFFKHSFCMAQKNKVLIKHMIRDALSHFITKLYSKFFDFCTNNIFISIEINAFVCTWSNIFNLSIFSLVKYPWQFLHVISFVTQKHSGLADKYEITYLWMGRNSKFVMSSRYNSLLKSLL